MSRYDDDQAKLNTWATYLIIFSIGLGLGMVSSTNSEEKLRFEIYNVLPSGCQKIIDERQSMLNDINEAKSEGRYE